MQLKDRLNNNFDFLRVLAALCIIYTHSFNLLELSDQEFLMKLTNQKLDFAFVGLVIFFSVSGYLIAKSANSSSSFKNYLWKRFLRIQPLIIVVCILSVFLIGPMFTSISVSDYFTNISSFSYFRNIMPLFGVQFTLPGVFTKNIAESGVNGSLWTLILEERLYLIIGLVFISKIKFSKIFNYFIAIVDIFYFANYFFFDGTLIKYLNAPHIFYALIFLNASALYFLKIDFEKLKFKLTIVLFLILVLYFFSFTKINIIVEILVIPFVVICFAHIKSFTNYTSKFGDFTYGIYIFSFPVQQMLIAKHSVVSNPFKLFFLTLAIVVPLAILSWHLLEKKMISSKNRVI